MFMSHTGSLEQTQVRGQGASGGGGLLMTDGTRTGYINTEILIIVVTAGF